MSKKVRFISAEQAEDYVKSLCDSGNNGEVSDFLKRHFAKLRGLVVKDLLDRVWGGDSPTSRDSPYSKGAMFEEVMTGAGSDFKGQSDVLDCLEHGGYYDALRAIVRSPLIKRPDQPLPLALALLHYKVGESIATWSGEINSGVHFYSAVGHDNPQADLKYGVDGIFLLMDQGYDHHFVPVDFTVDDRKLQSGGGMVVVRGQDLVEKEGFARYGLEIARRLLRDNQYLRLKI